MGMVYLSGLQQVEEVVLGFIEFRDGLGGKMCGRLGLDISKTRSWDSLASYADEYDIRTEGAFTAAARKLQGVASTGERALLHAVLAACNFTDLADELARGQTWGMMLRIDPDYRLAVATVMARVRP
jgi:hypothetical protein